MQYYVVGNADASRFLSYISRGSISMYSQYYDAIELSTQTMGLQFKAYCESVDPDTTFKLYEVTVDIDEVVINQVGE